LLTVLIICTFFALRAPSMGFREFFLSTGAGMDHIEEAIVSWLQLQPNWVQETAARLLSSGPISTTSLHEITELLKTSAGQAKTKQHTFSAITGAASTPDEIRITSLGPVKGIDCLAPRTPLSFGKGNLTVVYGNNGSGKSGYTRILKRVCGKARAAELKSNVFSVTPLERSCIVGYSINGGQTLEDWLADGKAISSLASADIFDADASRSYLTVENSAAYSPPALSFFERLVAVTRDAKSLLQQQQDKLASKLPALPPEFANTKVGKDFLSLHFSKTAAQLAHVLVWSELDTTALTQLNRRLAEADPAAQARAKRTQKAQVLGALSALKSAANLVAFARCAEFHEWRLDAIRKRKAATEGALAIAGTATLSGVGSVTWMAMWKAAEQYSIREAYPAEKFPFAGEDANCPLCQQSLGVDAKLRLTAFNSYVQGVLEKAATAGEERVTVFIAALPAVPPSKEMETAFAAAGISDTDGSANIVRAWDRVRTSCEELRDATREEQSKGFELADLTFCIALEAYAARLEDEAVIFDADSVSFDRAAATKNVLELQGKKGTVQQGTAITDELKRLATFENFDKWKKATTSVGTATSKKAGEISEAVLTEAYISRFNDELKALGASGIKVELTKTRIQSGVPLHLVKLRSLIEGSVGPAQILSEGEFRIVALAAFLADVTGKQSKAPFIFDDPISSLDHDYEWKVALRLADLAKDRQVLVFTHRLSLYGALDDAAKKAGEKWREAHLSQICIESFGGTSGHPVAPEAWNTATKAANNILIQRLDGAKKYADAGDIPAYRIHAQAICTDFRKLLERTVEDDLLHAIVKRHRRSVTTDNKVGKLHRIEKEDGEYFDTMMTKYSCYEHSQSTETPVFLPAEHELRGDLTGLKAWREKFHARV
jgi:energy-coupling factor transporter ATP-binding protein EcfA2